MSHGMGGLSVDELKTPTYSGIREESVGLFYAQINQYSVARGTRWTSEIMAPHMLAVLGRLLRGPEAQ